MTTIAERQPLTKRQQKIFEFVGMFRKEHGYCVSVRDIMQQFQDANGGRHVYPGINGDFDDFAEIAARIQAARDAGAAGHAIFSYSSLNARGYWDDLAGGPYARPATPAPLPWR